MSRNLVLEFIDSKGDFGGSGGKSDYHLRKADEHKSLDQFHTSKMKTKGDAHNIAAEKHAWAASDHSMAASMHSSNHELKHTASKTAETQSELAHRASNQTGRVHNEATESKFGTTPETQFHHLSAMPHKGGIRISGATKNDAHALQDGKKHSGEKGHGHLVTSYHGGEKDYGKSHFTVAHRDGDVVHFRDHKTGAHVATISHSDLASKD